MMTLGAEMLIIAEVLNVPLIGIFASYDANLLHMASRGFRIYAVAFLFMGINIWASGFFTALGNGAISAAISFIRAFLFQLVAIFLLPIFLKLDGVWLAIVVAEFVSIFMSAAFLYAYRKQYQYL